MKKLKRPLMLCELLMRTPILTGIAAALVMLTAQLIVYAAIIDNVARNVLFSKTVERAGFELIFTAAVLISMGILAASIARYWFGAKSAITLHMLPVSRVWMLVGWTLGGVFMILSITIAQHAALNIAEAMLEERLAILYQSSEYYLEPNSVWLAYVRVDFLHLILPRGVFEWARAIILLVGMPIATASVTLGLLSGRRFVPMLCGVTFLFLAYATRITTITTSQIMIIIGILIALAGNTMSAASYLKKGEAL